MKVSNRQIINDDICLLFYFLFFLKAIFASWFKKSVVKLDFFIYVHCCKAYNMYIFHIF